MQKISISLLVLFFVFAVAATFPVFAESADEPTVKEVSLTCTPTPTPTCTPTPTHKVSPTPSFTPTPTAVHTVTPTPPGSTSTPTPGSPTSTPTGKPKVLSLASTGNSASIYGLIIAGITSVMAGVFVSRNR